MNIPDDNLPRVVIIGGGFGGLNLGKSLRKKGFQVVMIDKNNFHTFQPLLYQVATAGLEPDSIAYPLRKIFEKQEHFYFRMAEAKEIQADKNLLITNIGPIEYDHLVIATGSNTNYFGMSEVEANAMGMKSIREALDLRSLILQNFEQALLTSDIKELESHMNFVIVGGGPTGVELAGALAELKKHVLPNDYPDLDLRKMRVHLVEAAPKLLPPMSEVSSKKSEAYLKELGVNVWTGNIVEAFDGDTVRFKSGKTIQSKTLIWAAGVTGTLIKGVPETAVERGRYKVDVYNRLEGHENIYAIGDVALMATEAYPKGHPMVAPVANQQGTLLGENLKRQLKGQAPKAFVYKDKGSMATIGRNRAVVDLKRLKFQGLFAWFVWMFVHLLTLVGFRNKVVTFFNWVYNYLNFDRGVRLIIRPYKKKS